MAVPRTPSPPKPASLARTALALAADAYMLLSLAVLWLISVATSVRHIGRLACGRDCRVVVVAAEVRRFVLPFTYICAFSVNVYINRMGAAFIEIKKDLTAGIPGNRIGLGVLGSVPFIVLMFLGKGSIITDVGAVGADAMYCFLVMPPVTRMMWSAIKYRR